MAGYLKSLDDFLLQAKASGKKYASGTTTALEGSNGSVNTSYIAIYQLEFIPRTVFVIYNDDDIQVSLFATKDMTDLRNGMVFEQMQLLHSNSHRIYTSVINDANTYSCRTILGISKSFQKQLFVEGAIYAFSKTVKWYAFE